MSTSGLQTDRLLLVEWGPEHVELLARLASLPEVMTFIGPGRVWSRERAEEVSQAAVQHWADHGFGWRVAVEQASGRQVGFLG